MQLQNHARLILDGGYDLARAIASGDMPKRHVWVALKGAGRYWRALAAGNIASEEERERRRKVCLNCPLRTDPPGDELGLHIGYCGEPFHDRTNETPATCGCLCEAKLTVRNEACPNGYWKDKTEWNE